MPLVRFDELMDGAEKGTYAVGYFESWDLMSLLAVADAASLTHSPVLLGFSGLFLSHKKREAQDPLAAYVAMGLEVCRDLPVPAALVYNESPDFDSVLEAARLGFSLVMYSDENLDSQSQRKQVDAVTREAQRLHASVEGEIAALPGLGGALARPAAQVQLTDVEAAEEFVALTGVDALAVNLGQMHMHGRWKLGLDLDRLRELKSALTIPLVLHGASSVRNSDLEAAINLGIRKINVGSRLKQIYFEVLRDSCNAVIEPYNPYLVIGSGLAEDVLMAARLALRNIVADYMVLFGSAGKASDRRRYL
jgi:fructose-bisphosphate aldolase class II